MNQKKEDMVEMEDIRDCNEMQMEEEKTVDEQTENISDQVGLEFRLRSENTEKDVTRRGNALTVILNMPLI